jgi:hypothetical protein
MPDQNDFAPSVGWPAFTEGQGVAGLLPPRQVPKWCNSPDSGSNFT